MKTRTFLIKDIDCEIEVEVAKTRKEVLDWLDEYVENLEYDWFDGSDDSFAILYKDGSEDAINEEYNGHKIKRNNIASIVYTNACTDIIFGNFEMNEYGVCSPAFETSIDDANIIEK